MDNEVVGSAGSAQIGKKFFSSFIRENPISSLSAGVVSTGFLIILIFFGHIGYVPDLAFSDVASVLYSAALLGIFITAYSMFTMVVPGLVLSAMVRLVNGISNWHVLAVSLSAALIWWIVLCAFLEVPGISWSGPCFYVLIAGIAIVSTLAGMWASGQRMGTVSHSDRAKVSFRDSPYKCFFGSLAAIAITAISMSISLLFITIFGSKGEINTETGWRLALILLLAVSVVAFAATFIASTKHEKAPVVTMILAPILLFVVLNLTQSFSSIPVMVVKALGFGGIDAARLVVDSGTCNEISESIGQKICRPIENSNIAVICPVIVRSRIGSQFVLDFASLAFEAANDSKQGSSEGKESSNRLRLVWVTSDRKGKASHEGPIFRRVVLDKKKILAWWPLSGIPERDAQGLTLRGSKFPAVGASLPLNWVNGIRNERGGNVVVINDVFSKVCNTTL